MTYKYHDQSNRSDKTIFHNLFLQNLLDRYRHQYCNHTSHVLNILFFDVPCLQQLQHRAMLYQQNNFEVNNQHLSNMYLHVRFEANTHILKKVKHNHHAHYNYVDRLEKCSEEIEE